MQNLDLKTIAAWLNNSNIEWLELTSPRGSQVCLRRGDVPQAAVTKAATAKTSSPSVTVAGVNAVAQGVGVFLDHHPLRNTPFVQTGQAVAEGECVGLLQVGTLLLPVSAPCGGVAGAYAVVPGHTVGYGTPVLPIHPA